MPEIPTVCAAVLANPKARVRGLGSMSVCFVDPKHHPV